MTNTTPQGTTGGPTGGSAKIYQFPVGGRAGLSTGRGDGRLATDVTAQRLSVVGNAWYHDAAIEEAKHGYEH